MSYFVEQATRPEQPKKETAQEAQAKQIAAQQRLKQEAEAREKMMKALKEHAQAAQKAAKGSNRPINPTAPTPPSGKSVAAGALDISEDWFKKRKPGEQGIRQLEESAKQNETTPPAPVPSPRTAPAVPTR
jgi:hypothetical protein